jgi:hypothetical protein
MKIVLILVAVATIANIGLSAFNAVRNLIYPATEAAAPFEAYPRTPGQVVRLAQRAWNGARTLPGTDGKYNFFVIGMDIAEWEKQFHEDGQLLPSEDKAFSDAYTAIAQQSEKF